MNAAEMHAFERAMMDDPMLADAVDGYQSVITERNIDADLADLKTKINPKKENGKVITGFFRPWMSVAAGLIIVLTAVLFYRYQNQNSPAEIVAVKEQKAEDTVPALKETVVDSTTVAINDAQPVITVSPKVLPLKKSKQVKDNAALTEDKSDFAKSEAVAAPPVLNEVVIAPATPKPAAAQKKNEPFTYSIADSETKAKTKLPTLNKFTGVVVDENNNPLPFANITEVKSRVGTYADAKGNFTMVAADSVISIETRSVGYSNANVLLRNNQQQKIVLKDEAVTAGTPTRDQLFERNRNRTSVMKEEVTEMESEPADGWDKYSTYVLNNLRTPDINDKRRFNETQLQKEVELSFDVNPDGSIANFKVERSNCSTCNTEAIRIIKEGPKWKSKTGKKERARFTVQF
ncbi:carboxypeptidase-like regulatory domain-containing protein [Lacibacter sediminis]|uniref:Carboxypeptidase-like regulatory domain-containing protein n=1 Tax=Lacibacter sediminis TaxID=2760713 RepID=A0A7G5XBY4_9BACT|nr:carboxypeptidase-like regulatory domain-containing protein [Lacibacter sediminis]QNA42987.1 carboxypeptidase-like regulatory domain-containing protein [Lacibacter sediminis]